MEVGHNFQETELRRLWYRINKERWGTEPVPWLAALVCCSVFDIALHDAYGVLHDVRVYETYNGEFMNSDLSEYLTPAENSGVSFKGKYPEAFFATPPESMPAWHLVGGKDLIEPGELTGLEPDDGYPVLLRD